MASPVSVLSEGESWRLLASVPIGRFVTTIGTRLEIFPVNFAVQDRTVLFRTAEGTKLITAIMSDRVIFEADGHTVTDGWSVILRGTAELLQTAEDIAVAERTQLMSWTSPAKRRYVRITPKEISGRFFTFDQTQ
ncbi:pyridoxamine 5'-phosphate oxidase family protein [Mycolicibacterium smegmatis]|uniref:pyridoxamine 5'-phosphate oxidase family protein n=1 Tax=Mycolicibacterium smegmatis TaxID=1772 RepID=UPI0020A40DE0|nr:pyridoxamine 5'-phosphate oxidase family protein [Mycolicibacterium smegmatis]MCP2622031.1 pyridoxamine 5'-phosphate oxidase family protein [Mycolicibacterium smegmatis]